jgi:hypothetical protein
MIRFSAVVVGIHIRNGRRNVTLEWKDPVQTHSSYSIELQRTMEVFDSKNELNLNDVITVELDKTC